MCNEVQTLFIDSELSTFMLTTYSILNRNRNRNRKRNLRPSFHSSLTKVSADFLVFEYSHDIIDIYLQFALISC